MHYRLPLFVIVAFSFFISFSYLSNFSDPIAYTVYKCPPCGCPEDHKHFTEPGLCSSCNMKLYPVTGSPELAAITGSMLKNNVNTLYTKFIYPSFIIGILLGFLSLLRRKGKSFNPFLGGILLVIALYGFKNQLFGISYGLSSDFRTLFVPISFIMLLGPLSYFYIRTQTESFSWKRKHFIHFIPALLFFIGYALLLLSPDTVKRSFMTTPFEPFFGHYEQLLAVVLLLAYLFYSSKRIHAIERDSKDRYKWNWITRFQFTLIFLAGIWLFIIGVNNELYEMGVATVTYNPLWIAFSLIIYWVIAEVMLNPKYFFSQTFYSGTNGYSIEKLESDKSVLLKAMEEDHPYLDPSLSLDKLAIQTEMNPKYLSLILNNTLNKNFYEFVNEYRIEKVKELLLSPDLKHLTIAAIANEAGFNSKSSFNSIFKKYTNLTPKEYLKQNNLQVNGENGIASA